MSSAFKYEVMRGHHTEEEVRDFYKSTLDEMKYDSGRGDYAGNWTSCSGFRIRSEVFKDIYEAENWLVDHADKYGAVLAVRYGNMRPFPSSAAEKKIVADYVAIKKRIESFNEELVSKVRSGKTALRACPHCESKIATRFIHSIICPVCEHDFISTDTSRKQLAALKAKMNCLETKYREAKKKADDKAGTCGWMMGAWCSD